MPTALLALALFFFPQESHESVRRSAEATVRSYLDALNRLDQEAMNAFVSPDCMNQYQDQPPTPSDRIRAQNFRDFERAVDTEWSYEIINVAGETVTAIMRERNLFYDLLGVGDRTMVEIYTVKEGLIVKRHTLLEVNQFGDYDAIYQSFKDWLFQQPGGRDPAFVIENRLIFDKSTPSKMLPWLRKWDVHRKSGG